MTDQLELVMYSRTTACPFVSLAKRVLDRDKIPYREIYIDADKAAEQRVLQWTGFLSVPTLVIVRTGAVLPEQAPEPLPTGASPRGVDRGSMITEPNEEQLMIWLRRLGFLSNVTAGAGNE